MKKVFAIFGLVFALTLTSCKPAEFNEENISAITSIADLYTLEVYYNNVAKSVKEAGSGLLHLGERDRKFWIEYTGSIKLGVDLKESDISVEGNTITIDLPEAAIMGQPQIISYDRDSYTIEKDGRINANILSAEDMDVAVADAQAKMLETVTKDTGLHERAKERAKVLINEYIESIAENFAVEYEVVYK